MSAELISRDPLTGLETWLEFDELNPKKFHIHHRQDVEPILERNKLLQNDPDYKKLGIKNGLQHVASVPDVWIHHLLKKHNVNVMSREDWPKVKRLLSQPEYRHLRATLGTI